MPYTRLIYHLIWTTKRRSPVITREIKPALFDIIKSKAQGLGGYVYAIGGIDDHVHIVTTIPPAITISKFIGQVKGASSHLIKQRYPDCGVYWQEEYGAFSVDRRSLPGYARYVRGQKTHHANNTTVYVLEQVKSEGNAVHENIVDYAFDYDAWLKSFDE